MDDIRDVKPPIDLPDWSWALWVLAAIAAIAVAYFFLKRKRPATAAVLPAAAMLSAWDIANRQLEELAHEQYPQKAMFKAFYIALSDIVRRYLENRFHIKAPEMTTEEFLNLAKSSEALNTEQKEFLRDFLNGCDLVKFAKHVPSINDAWANFNRARKLIDETK